MMRTYNSIQFFDGRRDGAWGPSQFSALMAPNAGPMEPGGPGGHVSPCQIWATLQRAKPFLEKAFYLAGLYQRPKNCGDPTKW